MTSHSGENETTYKIATSISLKFQTMEWDVSRIMQGIEVNDGYFFFHFSRSFI